MDVVGYMAERIMEHQKARKTEIISTIYLLLKVSRGRHEAWVILKRLSIIINKVGLESLQNFRFLEKNPHKAGLFYLTLKRS